MNDRQMSDNRMKVGASVAVDGLDSLNIAAICWLTHEVRTASYARYLGATLYNIHYLSNRHPIYAPVKYIPQCLKTWSVLFKQQPDLIYVMNPPVFAALSVYCYAWFSRMPFIMDTHTPSLYGRRWGWSVPLQRFLAKRALINIIDQERFYKLFEGWGASSVILERPPLMLNMREDEEVAVTVQEGLSSKVLGNRWAEGHPTLHENNQVHNRMPVSSTPSPFLVAVIGTFANDEPVEIVVETAAALPNVRFSILGDRAKAPSRLIHNSPGNVSYPGYLMDAAYWDHLQSANAVMALTTFPHSLLGGAQEGMALGKPLILSRQPALTDYFTQGAIFIDHTVESIMAAVLACQSNQIRLSEESAELAVAKRIRWEKTFQELAFTLAEGIQA